MPMQPLTREPGQFISTSSRDRQVVERLNALFARAAAEGVSDIHIEDGDHRAVIRVRRSGALENWSEWPLAEARSAQDKIRMKARLSTSEEAQPLDGRMFFETGGRTVDMRVSILPVRTGHSVVLRLLDQNNAQRRLADIEMAESVRERLQRLLTEPHGMFLVSGPTGSGKTSTLYSMLNELNTPDRKIVTIEDPVEYRLAGINQVNVTRHLTFADGLRSILRQDPDVILVGEIRDAETARIAVEAALTGHLVLSTTHANSADTTITRMLDLGVDPFSLATVLKGVMAQRLVRRLCPHCAERTPPSAPEIAWLSHEGIEDLTGRLARAVGCAHCAGTGYAGRMAVMELIAIEPAIIEAVENRSPAVAIQRLAVQQHWYRTLPQAATAWCRRGLTSFQEVVRITGEHANNEQSEESEDDLGPE